MSKPNKRPKHRGFQPLDSQQVARRLGGRYVFGLHHRHRLHLLVSPLHDRMRIDGESDHILRLQEAINEL